MTISTVFVDGRWSTGDGEEYASVDPSLGTPFATWRLASVAQADAAVAAARAAFASWSRTEPAERAVVLRRFADLLEKNHEELAQLVVTEVGSPISLARTLQTATPVSNLRWAADVAESGPRGGYRERLAPLESPTRVESELLRVPIGVVAAVTPYNYPVNMIAWKVGPALAAGCSVVLLPSPRGTLCSVEVVRLAEEAGVPPGVLNL
ncbi:MAG TPA: aldehyde dehydrogenase family protein, partial [Lapillicoccus sp.]|nr:aldehyde dehydrogenase family protein [Lapillicoccus sp.]